uniref:C2 tensin-type domain-containing protein n=1 Tax=Haemonchus contortus TaxID=6289 RepID=A0A7I4YPF5_HAECO
MAIVDETAGKCPEMCHDSLPNPDITLSGGGDYGGDHALVGSVSDVVLPKTSSVGDFTRLGSLMSSFSSRRSSARLSRNSTASELGRNNKTPSSVAVESNAKNSPNPGHHEFDDITPGDFLRIHHSTRDKPITFSTSLTPLKEESESTKDNKNEGDVVAVVKL